MAANTFHWAFPVAAVIASTVLLSNSGSVELFVGKRAVEKAAPWKSPKYRTFPLRLKIRQGQPDFHFSHRPHHDESVSNFLQAKRNS
jgi:hypothetical protein